MGWRRAAAALARPRLRSAAPWWPPLTHPAAAGLPLAAACRYELGRQPASTKLSSHVTVRRVRVRGGNQKFRALRLDHGNFSWGSEVRACFLCSFICISFFGGWVGAAASTMATSHGGRCLCVLPSSSSSSSGSEVGGWCLFFFLSHSPAFGVWVGWMFVFWVGGNKDKAGAGSGGPLSRRHFGGGVEGGSARGLPGEPGQPGPCPAAAA